MRRLSTILISAALLAALLTSTVPVAGAKSTATLTNVSGPGDCNFHVTFTWDNYGRKSYTAHLWWLYDGQPVPHPNVPDVTIMDWTETVGGTGTMSYNAGFSALAPTEHAMTYRATLSTTGTHPRVLVEKELTETVYCLPVGD